MRKFNFFLITSIIILVSYSCKDIIETNLEDEVVYLLSPPDSMITYNTNITFWWDNVADAEGYNLQIVSADFDSIVDIIADTNITNNKFENVYLYPGEFEWRVRAYNGSSSTYYYGRYFRIDSTENVEAVVLIYPLNNTYSNDELITFQWRDQVNADFYRFKLSLDESDIIDENVEGSSITLPDDVANFDEIPEGELTWKVQAINDVSQSIFTANVITVDRTAPSKPLLQSPPDGDTVTTADLVLKWERPSTTGSPITDSLFVYRDTTTTTPIISFEITETEYSLEGAGNGKYFWKVKSVDAAGNESDFSTTKQFAIQVE